jgi:two-component system, NarL family, response regulator LiaR
MPVSSTPEPPLPAQARRLSVVLVDDDPIVRGTLRDALQAAGITVVAEAADGREGVELILEHRPDVAVIDIVMPELDGISATRLLRSRAPELRVLLLTHSQDERLGLLGLRVGAGGHLVKDAEPGTVVDAVQRVARGEPVVSALVTARMIEQLRRLPDDGRGLRPVRSTLTAREWEVLDLLCIDLDASDIAEALGISIHTSRTHVKRILRKLGVHSSADAVLAARRMRAELGSTGEPVRRPPATHP